MKNIYLKRRLIFTLVGSLIISLLGIITVLTVPNKNDYSYAAETPTGAGWWFDWSPLGYGNVQTWLGAFDLGSNRKGYCVEVGIAAGSPGEYPGGSGYYLNNRELGYLIGAYSNSSDYLIQAALAAAIHSLEDRGQWWPIVNANLPSDIKSKYQDLIWEAYNKTLNPNTVSNSSYEYTAAKRIGKVTVPISKNYNNSSLVKKYKATITGDAVFKTNNSKNMTGNNGGSNPIQLEWVATGTGNITVKFEFEYEPTQVWKTEIAGLQPMIEIPDYKVNYITKDIKFPVSDKINPELITTTNINNPKTLPNQDISRSDGGVYRSKGESATDKITIWAKEGSWITDNNYNPIPVTLTGTLYGPYNESKKWLQNPESQDLDKQVTTIYKQIIPPNSAILGDEIKIKNSGIYTWQWKINIDDQPEEYKKYFASGVNDGLFKNNEIIIGQMEPEISTTISNRTAYLGQSFYDTLNINLPNNDIWIENQAVRFDGTLYGPYNQPEIYQNKLITADDPIINKQSLTFTQSGSKNTESINFFKPGFYTWNWQMPYNQNIRLRQKDLSEGFWQEIETISLLAEINHSSKMQEYNINSGGRVFDTINISGMPDDHGDFKGLTGTSWLPDIDTANFKIYYYGQIPPKSQEVPTNAMLFYETTLPAKNGQYIVGKTKEDAISPTHCGYYGAIYSFAGDDRVRSFQSPANDIDEQFYIDCGLNSYNNTAITNYSNTKIANNIQFPANNH
ncbi:MAG: hypothetical protein LBT99_01910, partial [Bifidobacteriaceae bacterium]|nr:hypothetical protein [Bifidobacteriaceae bacterium]